MTGTASAAAGSAADRQSRMPVVLSVNVGLPKIVLWLGKAVYTGVW